jgi:hypothetical protein
MYKRYVAKKKDINLFIYKTKSEPQLKKKQALFYFFIQKCMSRTLNRVLHTEAQSMQSFLFSFLLPSLTGLLFDDIIIVKRTNRCNTSFDYPFILL